MSPNLRRAGWELAPETMIGLLLVSYFVATGSSRFAAWLAGEVERSHK